jgi:dTDP-glucose pyrophosphorylase/CBS domain-containing protein
VDAAAPRGLTEPAEGHLVYRDITKLCVGPGDPMWRAVRGIDEGSCGIVLVLSPDGELLGTVTDGDVRRALLKHVNLEMSIEQFMQTARTVSPHPQPVTAPVGTEPAALIALMTAEFVRQVPLLDDQHRVVDLVVQEDLLPISGAALGAVIMAGGAGTRLLPLTEDLPKPMLPVDGRPMLEHIIEQLQTAGIHRVSVSTHYKPEKIIEHFGDGRAFGVELEYVNEDRPLGTAGALGLMSHPSGTQLVINGDILTQVDLRAMLSFHQEHRADMTVAVRRHAVQIPYGVVECEGVRLTDLKEKPHVPFLVNAGVYLLEPSVYEFIPNGERINMTDLIDLLLKAGRPVVSFPIHEYWMDVGQHGDYAQAQHDARRGGPDRRKSPADRRKSR